MRDRFDRMRIQTIVSSLGDRLPGEWLLVGGALVSLWLEPRRVTENVDVVAVGGEGDARLRLLELAEDLGLPVEALNSAADFFVNRIPGWRDEIEVFHRGHRGTVYRPTPTLFLLLKISRLSEQDLRDCLTLLTKVRTDGLSPNVSRVKVALDALPPPEEEGVAARRRSLSAALARGG